MRTRWLLLSLLFLPLSMEAQVLGPGDTVSRRVQVPITGTPYRTYYDVYVGQIKIGRVGSQAAPSTAWVAEKLVATALYQVLTPTYPTATAAQRRLVAEAQAIPTPPPIPPAPLPIDPRGYSCWSARDAITSACIDTVTAPTASETAVLRRYGKTPGYVQWMWHGKITPTDPSLPPPIVTKDTTIVYVAWQPVIVGSLVTFPYAMTAVGKPGTPPASVPLPGGSGRVDTLRPPPIIIYDTVKSPPIIVHDTVFAIRVDTVRIPVTPGPSGTVELPRTFLDTSMPAMPLSGDTLVQVWPDNGAQPYALCKGPNCANPELQQRVNDYTAILRNSDRARLLRGLKPKAVKVAPRRKEPVG